MNDLTDQQLLSDYADRRSEAVFSELVRRHVDLVYSAALRMLRDEHLAEDVTQGVFFALSQNIQELIDYPVLAGWLHRTARNLASKTVRSEVRRRSREQEVAAMNELLSAEPEADWEDIAPNLDAALDELSDADRNAILLRYFERKSTREMAQTLNISSEAAQKRVHRAVERLRGLFVKCGISIGTSGFVTVVSANVIQAAPVGLVATISTTTVLAGSALTTSVIATTTKAVVMTTLQKTIAATVLAVVIGTPLVVQQRTLNDVQVESEYLLQVTARIDGLREERDSLAYRNSLAYEFAQLQENHEEILQLREETAAFTSPENLEKIQMTQTLEGLQQEINDINRETELLLNEGRIKMQVVEEMKQLGLIARLFAIDYEDRLPTSFEEIIEDKDFEGAFESHNNFMDYEFYPHEVPVQETQPQAILFREKEPRLLRSGEWTRGYTFADGSVQQATSPTSDFSVWEELNSDLEAGRASGER